MPARPSMQRLELQRRFVAFLVAERAAGPRAKAVTGAALRLGVTPESVAKWRSADTAFDESCRRILDRKVPPPLEEFRLEYFGHPSPVHHRWMMEVIHAAEPDSLTMILAAPESAKTTLLVDYACRRLVDDPNWRIAVITEGQDLAKKIVGQIASRMDDPVVAPRFFEDFGPFKAPDRSRPWTDVVLQVLGTTHDEKEPSVEAKGAGSKLYGGRYDDIFLDDLQSTQNLNDTAKLLRYVRQTVLSRLSAGVGRTTAVGSRVGAGDVWEAMLSEGMVDALVRIPALVWLDAPGPAEPATIKAEEMFVRAKGKVLLVPGVEDRVASMWPEHWPLQRLAVRRSKVGEEVWARTFQQLDVVSLNAAFPQDVVDRSVDASRSVGPGPYGTDTVCTLDPGFDDGTCAAGAYAFLADKLLVLDSVALRGLGTTEEILALIGQWSARYRPTRWIIEINNFQRGLARDHRLNELAERWGFSIVSHTTGRNKHDPVLGVRQLGASFSAGEVSIPWKGVDTQDRMRPLCRQLVRWVPSKSGVDLEQDLVVCLWFAWLQWQEERRLIGLSTPRMPRPSWMREVARA